jgi:hypothetical protein
MSEKTEESSNLEIGQEIHDRSVDWFLQILVSLANHGSLEMSITLVLGGSVVSGTLISGKKYFDMFSSSFSAAWPGEDKEEIRQSFAKYGTIFDQEDEQEQMPQPQYIHLADARFPSPNGNMPTNSGVLWRGRINAISGFSLGELTPDNP